MVWAFQPTPHDMWDYDAVNENILVDCPIRSAARKALVHFDRNGFAYTMDRATAKCFSRSRSCR
jgi:alcohol dehydrogenase (cytochrome c)